MGPMPGSVIYKECASVNRCNLSVPQSAGCTMGITTVPHCRVVVTVRSSGIIWRLAHSRGLVIKQLGVPSCTSPAAPV